MSEDGDDAGDGERTAWGYVRLSQQGRDVNLDEQKKVIRRHARREGLKLQTTRNEGDRTSGFNDDRKEYQLVREAIREERVDAIVVRDRARLSRDFDDRLSLIVDFRASDTEWHVVEAGGHIDLNDVYTAAMECVHAAMDHVKKKMEIERARKAVTERIEEKGYDHGRPPFGFEFDDQGRYWVPTDDGEFETAREILMFREQGKSYNEIAELTNTPRSTVRNVTDRREMYEEASDRPEPS